MIKNANTFIYPTNVLAIFFPYDPFVKLDNLFNIWHVRCGTLPSTMMQAA